MGEFAIDGGGDGGDLLLKGEGFAGPAVTRMG